MQSQIYIRLTQKDTKFVCLKWRCDEWRWIKERHATNGLVYRLVVFGYRSLVGYKNIIE